MKMLKRKSSLIAVDILNTHAALTVSIKNIFPFFIVAVFCGLLFISHVRGFSGEGTLEVWSIKNGGGGWSHPVHVHFEEGIILSRGGKAPPEWEKWARKDLYRIGPLEDSTDSVVMAIHFREFAGTYMEHCHNTQHEDHSMLLRWDIEHPGQLLLMPAPIPTWDGVEYVDSAALPTFRTGDGIGLKPQ